MFNLKTEHWLKLVNQGKVEGSIMVDFGRAFDLVDRVLLLEKKKLSCYKNGDNFLQLTKSYLDNRKQVVSVNNKSSDMDHVKFGVPQGSILG